MKRWLVGVAAETVILAAEVGSWIPLVVDADATAYLVGPE